MGNTNNDYSNGEINSMNGCGVDNTDEMFYKKIRHVHTPQENQEDSVALDDLVDAGDF